MQPHPIPKDDTGQRDGATESGKMAFRFETIMPHLQLCNTMDNQFVSSKASPLLISASLVLLWQALQPS